MKASDLFVKCLENEWVEYIFWVPWEENLDLVESLRNSKIELILTRNEQTAVFMAANYWRFTWKVWVALATLWPWATNMVTWVAYAQLWWMPVLVITWQKPIKKSKQGQFQVIDIISMMKPITKFATWIANWARIPSTIRNAFKIATEERPWAVHIEFAEDISAEVVDSDYKPLPSTHPRRPEIDEKMLNRLKEKLENATSPIILVWAWANRKLITKYLTKFILKTWMPFFTSQMWKWVVDERLSQCIWTAALTENDYIHDAINESDLIITVWYDVIEKPTNLIEHWKKEAIHINFYPAQIDDVYTPSMEVVWDIANTFWQLFEADIDTSNWEFGRIYQIAEQNREKLEENFKLEEKETKLMPRKLAEDLRSSLDDFDIVSLDNGLYKVWMARNYKAYAPNSIILDNALATMWAGLASWMVAKMVLPKQKSVVISGDWGFVMNLWDLETAVRLWNDLVVIILNDNAYWMIKWKQKWAWFEEYWLDLPNPDFVKLAESFGANWMKVEHKDDFKPTLEKALKMSWVTVIEVMFKYPENIS